NILAKVFRFLLLIAVVWGGFVLGQAGTYRVIHSTMVYAAQKDTEQDSSEKSADKNNEKYENLELFQKVLHFVESHYVDQVNSKELIHGAIKGMLASLDPHSNFLPENIFRDMKVDTAGRFGGLGIEVG